jgi:hypothetical protein
MALNQLTLMSTRGFVLLSVPIAPAGKTAAAKELLHKMSEPKFQKA